MSEEKAPYMGEVQEENTYEIREEAPHDYFCQIPNLVDDLNLTPQAYRLYGHLKKVAGESGKCWQSTKTLATFCNMSAGTISEAKKELENTYPPLIKITSKKTQGGWYHEILITDIWRINHDYWTGKSVHIVKTPPKRSHCENPRSHCETKKTPIKKTPNIGTDVPNASLDWKIAGDQTIADTDLQGSLTFDLQRAVDTANLIGTGQAGADGLALAFQEARKINLPSEPAKIKAQRKAAREMLEMHVKPQHVRGAVRQLVDKGMTVTDLFSVSKTAISLANPADAQPSVEVTYDPDGAPESW